jgi:hypothetical protein
LLTAVTANWLSVKDYERRLIQRCRVPDRQSCFRHRRRGQHDGCHLADYLASDVARYLARIGVACRYCGLPRPDLRYPGASCRVLSNWEHRKLGDSDPRWLISASSPASLSAVAQDCSKASCRRLKAGHSVDHDAGRRHNRGICIAPAQHGFPGAHWPPPRPHRTAGSETSHVRHREDKLPGCPRVCGWSAAWESCRFRKRAGLRTENGPHKGRFMLLLTHAIDCTARS